MKKELTKKRNPRMARLIQWNSLYTFVLHNLIFLFYMIKKSLFYVIYICIYKRVNKTLFYMLFVYFCLQKAQSFLNLVLIQTWQIILDMKVYYFINYLLCLLNVITEISVKRDLRSTIWHVPHFCNNYYKTAETFLQCYQKSLYKLRFIFIITTINAEYDYLRCQEICQLLCTIFGLKYSVFNAVAHIWKCQYWRSIFIGYKPSLKMPSSVNVLQNNKYRISCWGKSSRFVNLQNCDDFCGNDVRNSIFDYKISLVSGTQNLEVLHFYISKTA
jgi:hypothetical protein